MKRSQSPNSVKKALRKIAVSEKRLAANRANAAKSTGPKTPEGKQRSARNAIKHGFAASSFAVVRIEGLDEIDKLKADAVSVYQPANPQEMFACERIALAQQQILRGMRIESGFFTTALDSAVNPSGAPFTPMSLEMLDGNMPVTREQNRNYALAEGLRRLSQASPLWTLILRYQAQAERMYRRAIEELQRLQVLRKSLPNEPIEQDQPQRKPQLATLGELNGLAPRDFEYNPTPPSEPESPAIPPSDSSLLTPDS